MKYLGSKKNIAKYLLPIILKDRKPGQVYVEPFVGGANTFEHVENPRIGGELNKYQYALLNALKNGWEPGIIDEEKYDRIHAFYDPNWAQKNWKYGKQEWRQMPYNLRPHESYPEELIGFAGIALSFKGKWWGGYSRDNSGIRNYAEEALNNVRKLGAKLYGAKLYNLSYDELPIPPNSLIYCDPPYANTTQYSKAETNQFDSNKFWEWCRNMVKNGHTVFVSEYEAPEDFQAIWNKQLFGTGKAEGSTATEKLFVHKDQFISEQCLTHIKSWHTFLT